MLVLKLRRHSADYAARAHPGPHRWRGWAQALSRKATAAASSYGGLSMHRTRVTPRRPALVDFGQQRLERHGEFQRIEPPVGVEAHLRSDFQSRRNKPKSALQQHPPQPHGGEDGDQAPEAQQDGGARL
jgi:hypothetical protein